MHLRTECSLHDDRQHAERRRDGRCDGADEEDCAVGHATGNSRLRRSIDLRDNGVMILLFDSLSPGMMSSRVGTSETRRC